MCIRQIKAMRSASTLLKAKLPCFTKSYNKLPFGLLDRHGVDLLLAMVWFWTNNLPLLSVYEERCVIVASKLDKTINHFPFSLWNVAIWFQSRPCSSGRLCHYLMQTFDLHLEYSPSPIPLSALFQLYSLIQQHITTLYQKHVEVINCSYQWS